MAALPPTLKGDNLLRKLPALAALVLATGLIAAGCGGDDDETTTTTSTTSSTGATGASGASGEAGSGAVAEINEICKETDPDIDAAFRKSPEAGIKEIESVLEQIGDVEGAEDDPAIATFISTAETDLATLETDPSSLGPESFAATDEAADEAGLTDCVG